MAYVSQEMKAKLAPTIKAICKKYNVKASIAVRHHSSLVLNIKQGAIDFLGNYNSVCGARPRPDHLPFQPATKSIDVNTYWYHEHFDGKAKAFLDEMVVAMKGPDFFDHSDIQSDYFHLSHYIDINIGQWDKPYAYVA
jgi:hypothetical protein